MDGIILRRESREKSGRQFLICVCFFLMWLIASKIQSAPLDTRFDLHGGLGSPAPGAILGLSGLIKVSSAHALGLGSDLAIHELEGTDSKLMTRSHDVVYERSMPLLEGFHFIRARIGAGAALVTESMDRSVAASKGEKTRKQRWAPHISAALALDLPIADLVWARVGLWGEKAHLPALPWQGGVIAGVVVGGPWLGLGD